MYRIVSALSIALFLLPAVAVAEEISGKIVSCSGCALNRLPELKSFLKDGEAEWYKNLEVTYKSGKKAVLTIYDGGEEKEEVTLSDYKTKADMHSLMIEKGFELKPEEELEEFKREFERKKKEKEEADEKARRKRRELYAEKQKKLKEEGKVDENETTDDKGRKWNYQKYKKDENGEEVLVESATGSPTRGNSEL